MKLKQFLLAVAPVTESQHGMFTTQQALRVGANRNDLKRFTQDGLLEHPCRSIYTLTTAPWDRWWEVRAKWLKLSPALLPAERDKRADKGGIITGQTAAAMHEIGVYWPEYLEFLVSDKRKPSKDKWTRFSQREIAEREYTFINGLPVATPSRAIVDLVLNGTFGDFSILSEAISDLDMRTPIDRRYLASELASAARPLGFSDGNALMNHMMMVANRDSEMVVATLAREQGLFEAMCAYVDKTRGSRRNAA